MNSYGWMSRPPRYLAFGLATIFLVFAGLSCKGGRENTVPVVRVIDGDTFVVRYDEREEKVRLIGVDCPESRRNAKAYRDISRLPKSMEIEIEQGKRATKFVNSSCV